VYVIIEENEEGAVNVWGPYDEFEDAKQAAIQELHDITGLPADGEILTEEESREGPWRISTEFHPFSWAVAHVSRRA
jgi:hypothetical protein